METCVNTLYVKGNDADVSTFFDFINETPDVGEYFVELEKSVEDIESDLKLPCASQSPWTDTFSVDTDEKTISWEASGYPSLLAVYNKLSKDFPALHFVLDFDNTEDEIVGCIAIRDGNISKKHVVYFEDGAIDLLLGNYGNEIMSLKVGEKIEVGIGMVEVECTGEKDAEDEISKAFNVVFQCDASPKIVVHVPKEESQNIHLGMDFMNDEWGIDKIEYSDADGNDDTTEGSNNGEMCVHAEKPWLEDFLAHAEKYVSSTPRTTRKAVKKPKETTQKSKKEVALEAMQKDGLALRFEPEELRADKDVVLEAVKQNGAAFEFASDAFKADREFVLEAVKQSGWAFEFVSDALRADKEVFQVAVKSDGRILRYASKELKADKEVVLEAVKRNGTALQHASRELKADKEIVLEAMKQDGLALKFALELKADKDVVLEAVKQNPNALQFASDELKAELEVA